MPWPKGRSRKPVETGVPRVAVLAAMSHAMQTVEPETAALLPEPPQYPPDWRPGMLLNVRNTGPDYTITLWPEEADPRKPERALHFTNPGKAQDFVSQWYSRQSHDPRAR